MLCIWIPSCAAFIISGMNCQLQILFQLYENVLYAAFLYITFSRLMFESNFIDGKVSCFSLWSSECALRQMHLCCGWFFLLGKKSTEKKRENSIVKNAARRNRISWKLHIMPYMHYTFVLFSVTATFSLTTEMLILENSHLHSQVLLFTTLRRRKKKKSFSLRVGEEGW